MPDPLSQTRQTPRLRPMWKCPDCHRRFANRRQSHFCGHHDLAAHLQGKPAATRQLYEDFVAAVQACGPVVILPEKTRIAFQVRMSFAAVMIRSAHLVGHLVLAARHERPCFHKIDSLSPHNHVHHFRIGQPMDLSAEFRRWLAAAYAVGEQRHLPSHTCG